MDYVPIRDAANAEIHEINFMKSVRALLKGIDLTSRAQTTFYGTYLLILLIACLVAAIIQLVSISIAVLTKA